MPDETWGLDARYHALIRDVLQQGKGVILPYIVWEGKVLSQRDFISMALEKISPVLQLVVTLQYRLDEPEKLEAFTQRTSPEIRRMAKGRIPKNVNIQAGLKTLRSLEISPPFLAFLTPTPEEIAQLKEDLKSEKEHNQRLVDELEHTRMRLTETEKEKQAFQEQVEQFENSRFSNRIRRVFSRSKAAPA